MTTPPDSGVEKDLETQVQYFQEEERNLLMIWVKWEVRDKEEMKMKINLLFLDLEGMVLEVLLCLGEEKKKKKLLREDKGIMEG